MIKWNYLTPLEFIQNNPTTSVSGYSTTTLSGIIATASDRVDEFLGYSLIQETVSNELCDLLIDSKGNLALYPSKRPVVSVSALSLVKGTISSTVAVSSGSDATYDIIDEYQVRFSAEDLSITSQAEFLVRSPADYRAKVTYVAGYAEANIPKWAKDATQLYVRSMLARANNTEGAKQISQGSISITYSETDKTLNDIQAERILRSHRRVAI